MTNKFNVYIDGGVLGLGDSIALMPIIEIYATANKDKNIFFSSKFLEIFYREYSNIFFLENRNTFFLKENNFFIEFKNKTYNLQEVYHLGYNSVYLKIFGNNVHRKEIKNTRLPLQQQMANFLNIEIDQELKPKITTFASPISKPVNKYICIATQTTMQARYWNNPNGWKDVISFLNIKGYSVICIDKDKEFGNLVYRNRIPENCIDMTGLRLEHLISLIEGCEFFIGLDSGLSWLAWALNKKVVQILGLSDSLSFKNPYSIINKKVCNSCFEDKSVTQFDEAFQPDGFLTCPKHKNTSKMFECTKEISADMVISTIKKIIK